MRHQAQPKEFGSVRVRVLVLGLAAVLTAVGGIFQVIVGTGTRERTEAADRLAAEARSTEPTGAPLHSQPGPSAVIAAPTAKSFALPPTRFSWPAAGLDVDVVSMDWKVDEPVNPPLDSNNFDPVAHWLKGTGESLEQRPVVLAAHTCRQGAVLCNQSTFPFNLLSFEGWAVGQPAYVTEADGDVAACALEDRRIVDKSAAFSFKNDPCMVVAFSCNARNPDEDITLVTFRCGSCT